MKKAANLRRPLRSIAVPSRSWLEMSVASSPGCSTSNHPALKRRTGDHAMTSITTKPDSLQPAAEMAVDLFDNWFDPIETEVRAQAREYIEELIRGELDAVLARPRYGRSQMAGSEGRAGVAGHRHGSRTRSLTGTFGPIEIAVPRARLNTAEGKTAEWKSKALRAYQRRTLAADALIASTYLAGTNTRRVRRALAALFGGAAQRGRGGGARRPLVGGGGAGGAGGAGGGKGKRRGGPRTPPPGGGGSQ